MKQAPTKIFNLDLSYPTDLAAGIALAWIGCHYAAWMPFGLGLLIVGSAVAAPNVAAYMQWRRDKKQNAIPNPDPINVGGES